LCSVYQFEDFTAGLATLAHGSRAVAWAVVAVGVTPLVHASGAAPWGYGHTAAS